MNSKKTFVTMAFLGFALLGQTQEKPKFDISSPASIKGTKVYLYRKFISPI